MTWNIQNENCCCGLDKYFFLISCPSVNCLLFLTWRKQGSKLDKQVIKGKSSFYYCWNFALDSLIFMSLQPINVFEMIHSPQDHNH